MFMRAKLAGLLDGGETQDMFPRPDARGRAEAGVGGYAEKVLGE